MISKETSGGGVNYIGADPSSFLFWWTCGDKHDISSFETFVVGQVDV